MKNEKWPITTSFAEPVILNQADAGGEPVGPPSYDAQCPDCGGTGEQPFREGPHRRPRHGPGGHRKIVVRHQGRGRRGRGLRVTTCQTCRGTGIAKTTGQ